MELGRSPFTYIPTWKGNDELPPEERLSVEILPFRGIDLYTADEDEDAINAWAEKELKPYAPEGSQDDLLKAGFGVLSLIKQLVDHTQNWKNFVFDGKVETEPRTICLRLPAPIGQDQSRNLLLEINRAITETSNMTEDEIKNYVGPSDGSPIQESTSATSAPEAANGQSPADIPQEQTELSV